MDGKKSFFETNLEALGKKDPGLAERLSAVVIPGDYRVIQARSGHPVLKIKTTTFHSLYNPEQEGRDFVRAHSEKKPSGPGKTALVYGFGFGYHLQAIAAAGIAAAVVETDLCILRLAMEHRDLKAIIERMDIFTDCACEELLSGAYVVWQHAPSVVHRRGAYEQLLAHAAGPAGTGATARCMKQRLKIIVVSPIYGGSLPVARYCAGALEQLGHDTQLWDASVFEKPFTQLMQLRLDEKNKKILYDLLLHLISEMVVATCGDVRPDLVLGLAQAPISLHALQRLKQSRIVTAFWFVEDYRFMEYWRTYAPAYDFYFTIQDGAFFDELQRLGVSNYACLPMAADPAVHRPLRLSDDEKRLYGSDLSFMGAGYYNRQKIFCGLMDFDLKIWGTDWDMRSALWKCVQRRGERIATEETVKIFNASLVNINLHSSAYHDAIRPDGDFVNPRTFEIAACGGFQLVDYREALERSFTVGQEMACYRSLEELRDRAAYYLRHPEQRAAIALRSRERVMREHTYRHRMQDLCAIIRERRPECFYRKAAQGLAVRDIASFCSRFPEVRPILDDVTGRGWDTDIDSIVASIRARSGQLQYPEAIFMLMKEYQALIQEHAQ